MGPQPPTLAAVCREPESAGATADAAPAGFAEEVVWSGLTNPVAVRFAADGRAFVAEKSGTIKVFDSVTDPTPTTFTGLQANVHNFWDRGLLGLALDPTLTGGSGTGSSIYVLYAYDHILGDGAPAPKWGDSCVTPPGPTTDGCVISGRLSRLAVSGTTITGPEQVLIEDWCQQYPSHSLGGLTFGADGALYVSAGDGANFNVVDYGQHGGTTSPVVTPRNPCGDPPGGAMAPPLAEGGALRSQDVRTLEAGADYRAVVLGDGPLAYWRLGETAGTNAADELAAHPGTYGGGPALGVPGALTGDPNLAVALNGTSQSISVAGASDFRFSGTAPFSAEVWFKHTADGTYRRILSAENSLGQGWQLYSQASSWGFLRTGVGGATEVNDGAPAGSSWVHAVATYDGTTMRLYENGFETPFPLVSSQGLPADTTFFIGRYGGANVSQFNGVVDEAAIYNYALTPAQVAAHYAAATRTAGADPTSLDGAILRVDPATGEGAPGNPFASSADPNARRIIAYGLRNPFRITARPGTSEVWIGDVGWGIWEEINRIADPAEGVAENFGWPCYEGPDRQPGFEAAALALCNSLYAQGAGAHTAPMFGYDHVEKVADETCPIGSSAITGLAFYPETGGTYPAAYAGGLFFADHSRDCVWFAPRAAGGQLDFAAVQTFLAPAANPVDLVIGPGADLFYVDFDGGTIRRLRFSASNLPPSAVISATPASGPAPLTVQFSGTASSDPEGSPLTYAWDLDGDGQFNDGASPTASRTYSSPGSVNVGLQVTDVDSATGTAFQSISIANDPPVPVIGSPEISLRWDVGQTISFNGSATDQQDGALPPSSLTWALVLQHCPSNCHSHSIQTWPGVASGSFNAPDHEYPSYLELSLTAIDSFGTSAVATVRLDPRTVVLSFATSPSGLALGVNQATSTAPFTRTVIVGSSNSVSAASPQLLNGLSYVFGAWSHGLPQTHQIVAPATSSSYAATYSSTSISLTPTADALVRSNRAKANFGTATTLSVRLGQLRSYIKFNVTGLTGPASSARLRLWVTDPGSAGGSIYLVGNSWTETGLTWNNAPAISGARLATTGAVGVGTWVEFNLGGVITGNGTYSFALTEGNSGVVSYASRESANDPILVITPQ
jgi:glucose/arabinose dehydrogenase/PKD repeat protein